MAGVDLTEEIGLFRRMVRAKVAEGASAGELAKVVSSLSTLMRVERGAKGEDTLDGVLARIVDEMAEELRG